MRSLFTLALKIIVTAVAGYLLGSLNTSLIVGKFYGVDVRSHGSGNAGATNTLRVLGKKATVFVTLGDILKGIIACLIGHFLVGNVEGYGNVGLMAGGISAIFGHNWPVFFGFKGGKGILTSLAVVLMMDWRIGLILLSIFLVVVLLTRYISLGSIIASALFPVFSAMPVFGRSYLFVLFALAIAALAIYRHKANISRLFKGTESKFGSKASKSKEGAKP